MFLSCQVLNFSNNKMAETAISHPQISFSDSGWRGIPNVDAGPLLDLPIGGLRAQSGDETVNQTGGARCN